MLVEFNILPDESRIWVYASEYRLTDKQQDYILKSIYDHLQDWEAHGVPLKAGVKIIENHFIIVGLDENKNGASGCSIDTLQNKIQQIENKLSISLLNRLNIFCIVDDAIVCIPSIDLKNNVDKKTLFYDLTIESKSQIHSFLKPISDGWCAKLVD
tara:strand:+ start:1879 stop:2346 length:468 start_codon:yes stop_codon:yes gene_type:complete